MQPPVSPTPIPTEHGLLPVGDSIRARVHYLVAQHHAMVVQTQFADAKAAALMTLSGVAALRMPLPPDLDPLAITPTVALFATVLLCLIAVIPRYRAMPRTSLDRFTWIALNGRGETQASHAEFTAGGNISDLMASLAASNVGGAHVLQKKFRLIRFAFLSAILAVLSVAAYALRESGWIPLVLSHLP